MTEHDWFQMFPQNYTWSAAVIAAISAAGWGGSEIGEIHRVRSALAGRVGDNAAWFDEWNKMAGKVLKQGEEAERAGRRQTAAAAFMRAANYIQTGERLMQPRTEESQEAYARSVELFKRGLPHVPYLSIEPVEVPFEGGKSLPGYFVKNESPPSVRWPTVVFFDGLDITKEMQYFRGTLELMKRGMACLLVDGPGNGESIRFRGLPLRYDYDVAGTAAVDFLETRGDADSERIAVLGISLGGYYAPRCAAFEKRFKACVAWGGIWDYQAAWKRRIAQQFQTALSVPGEHINWVLGTENFGESLKKLENFKQKGMAGRITCPFLLTHGAADAQVSMEDAQRLFDEVGSSDKTFKAFSVEEGGHQHCQNDNLTIGFSCIADWLAEKMVP